MMKNSAEFFVYLAQLAHEKRENAGFGGMMSDGGASRLEDEIEIYKAGQAGKVPDTWKNEYKEFTNKLDPKYAEYLELKKKFES